MCKPKRYSDGQQLPGSQVLSSVRAERAAKWLHGKKKSTMGWRVSLRCKCGEEYERWEWNVYDPMKRGLEVLCKSCAMELARSKKRKKKETGFTPYGIEQANWPLIGEHIPDRHYWGDVSGVCA